MQDSNAVVKKDILHCYKWQDTREDYEYLTGE